MFSLSTFVLVVALSLTAASAVPPSQLTSGHDQLAAAFVQAVASHDFASASQIYADISSQGHLDACAFKLATAVKNVVKSEQYKHLSENNKELLAALKYQLPFSVRNAVFATSVCIMNTDKREYLYAPNDEFLFSADSRNVFLWRLGTVVAGSNWTLIETLTPGDMQIVNEYGEFLFAAESHFAPNRRQIFTWVPSQWTGFSTNVWRFIPIGNEMILQNTWFSVGSENNEYFYSASNLYAYDANRHRVFSWDSSWSSGDFSNRWLIAEC